MKVCVIGSGGREHALAWRLAADSEVDEVMAVPGSAAMAEVAQCVAVDWRDTEALLRVLREHGTDLVVVGPEEPLVAGIIDTLTAAGLAVFGPSKAASQLEGSKVFAKEIMKKYNIPTAAYDTFTSAEKAKQFIDRIGAPVVVKADGLAAGKGVVVAQTVAEAHEAVDAMLTNHRFGEAGGTIVVEEFMDGEEVSLLAFADGTTVVPMIAVQDHKRIFDGDKGPNTGGMGTYAPAPILTEALRREATERILQPMIEAMKAEGMPYKGCLYAGLMITADGPKVVEFNVRFGDPETQVIMPLLDGSLSRLMAACAGGYLADEKPIWKEGAAACVMLASAGYPEGSRKGDRIDGNLQSDDEVVLFHSGTAKQGDMYVTNGGRVLGVVGLGDDLKEALDHAYARVNDIRFDGCQFRKDIGQKAFR